MSTTARTAATAAKTAGGELPALLEELRGIGGEAEAAFGGLSARQLNWKPAPEQWSVGQCFDHLIKTNQGFFAELEQLARGGRGGTAWERLSPLSGLFGRLILKGLAPASGRKFKAPRGLAPSAGDVEPGVISRFAAHQSELADLMSRAAASADLKKTVVTSPVSKFVTYTLGDAFRIVVTHERRHFEQARRVTEGEGFPRA